MSNTKTTGHLVLLGAITAIMCLAVFLFPNHLFSQAVTATVVGTMTDQSGAVVTNADVKLTNQATGAEATTKTNGSGNYQFTFLQPGTYTVTASQTGFKTETKSNIVVSVNTTTRVDVVFETGSSSETITVTEQAALLQTDRADVSAQIETRQVEDLPVGSQRNFQALESLVPGVSKPIYDHSSFFDAQNSQSFQVNGQSELSNNLQFEGIDDNERTGLLQVYIPPAAAIKTVDVETSNYAPEFGRSAGAVTNVVMKSGTNEFHGQAYEYNSISALSSRGYFNVTGVMPRTVNNYYGAALGGPIIPNHTFFFGDFLRYSNHAGQFQNPTVPTADFRTGDFSAAPTIIYDPATGNPDGTGRTPFPGNIIPASRISPIATRILALVPLPNIPGAGFTQNYQANTTLNNDVNTFDAKIDQKLHISDLLTGRFSWQRSNTVQSPIFGAAGGPAAGAFEGTGINTVYNTAIEYTHLFSPTLFTEFRGGVDHYRNTAQAADYGTKASTDIGIPGVNLDNFTSGLVGMDIAGYSSPMVGFSASLPWMRGETNIDLVNNWMKIIGNHSIKIGGEIRRVRDDLIQGQTFSPRGIFRFRDGQTALNKSGSKTSLANDFASFLLDVPSQVGRDLNVKSGSWRQTLYFGFIQDTWVASQKLTITYGVRYELYPPAHPSYKGGYSQYDPSTNTLRVSGYGDVGEDLGMPFNGTNFQPRIGFAFRAYSSTVIRGGFGVSNTPFQDNNYAFNYPVRQNVAYNSKNSYSPALLPDGVTPETMENGFPTAPEAQIPSTGILPAPGSSNWVHLDTAHYRDPKVVSYNLMVGQQFPGNWVLDIGYVGNQGRFIPSNYNLNASFVPLSGVKGEPYYQLYGTSSSIELLPKASTSNYNSLQAKLQHRFSDGFQSSTGFTWQKAMGYISTGGGLAGYNFYIDPHRDYSPLSFNHSITLAQSFIYALPFGPKSRYLQRGLAGWIAGGWQMSGVIHLQTGSPLFFSDSTARLNTPGTSQVPDEIKPFQKLKGIGKQAYWFDTSAFVSHNPTVQSPLGNMGKNVYSGPGSFTFDASGFRSFPMREGMKLQFRADAFNTLNHPNFNNPSTSLTSTTFGQVTGGGGGRSVQLAAVLQF